MVMVGGIERASGLSPTASLELGMFGMSKCGLICLICLDCVPSGGQLPNSEAIWWFSTICSAFALFDWRELFLWR